MKPITPKKILREIVGNLSRIAQWSDRKGIPSQAVFAMSYNYKAEALIELLEVAHSGSVGGCDIPNLSHRPNLFDRWHFLVVELGFKESSFEYWWGDGTFKALQEFYDVD